MTAPLIGVENVTTPQWAAVGQDAATVSFGRALRGLPEVIAVVLRLAWRSSRPLTVLAGVAQVVSGVVTAFALLATADVFVALLRDVPTPDRLADSLPAIAVVVGSQALRA